MLHSPIDMLTNVKLIFQPVYQCSLMLYYTCIFLTTCFISPEHKVLRVSYCDRAAFVVRHSSSNFYAFVRSRGHIFSHILMKLVQNVCLDGISDEFEPSLYRVKTRSLGQIFKKPYVGFRGQIFLLILMKLGQNVCFYNISNKFQNGSCQVKNSVKS